ncbi:MAG: hypothetical protein LBR64_01300 [Dysgonamonadaceae bacterium]|jgi:hypothetical protein|nr:hypothetical protein [Dysgonamonadaceae bacterium]
MKKINFIKICFLLLLFFGSFPLSAQSKNGLILGGGTGNISNVSETGKLKEILDLGGTKTFDYKFNFAIGYKFRIQPEKKSFFYDLDLYAGMKRINWDYKVLDNYFEYGKDNPYGDDVKTLGSRSDDFNYYFSLNASYNYNIYKNLHIGAGLEPTMYFESGWKFDSSLTFRVGYDFKYVDIAIGYKVGLLNPLKQKDAFLSGNLNDLQIQLFIPF